MNTKMQTFLLGTNGNIAIYQDKAIVQQKNTLPKVISLDEIPDYITSLEIYTTAGGHISIKNHE